VSDQSAQRRSADKLQELSLFRSLVIAASAAELRCCKFAPVPSVVSLTFISDGEKSRGFVQLSSRINVHIHECLILCLQIHLTKQFAVTGNQCSTILHWHRCMFQVSLLPPPPPSQFYSLPSQSTYMWLVHASAANSTERNTCSYVWIMVLTCSLVRRHEHLDTSFPLRLFLNKLASNSYVCDFLYGIYVCVK
jgi:hypothetical protein